MSLLPNHIADFDCTRLLATALKNFDDGLAHLVRFAVRLC
jgi:hypothetical protein